MTHEHKLIIKKAVWGLGIIGVFLVGTFFGRSLNAQNKSHDADIAAISNNQDLTEFWSVWKLLDDKYPFKEKVPKDADRLYGAISGMVASFGDPYTTFFPPQQAKLFSDDVKGEFSGVGMEVGFKDGLLTVIAPLKGSPAEKSGIKSGDVVVKIDDVATESMTIDEAISKIRGKIGTEVKLTIARKGDADFRTITITRDTIAMPIVDTKQTGDVFVISLYSFSENSAQLFNDALAKFVASKSKKLIIDLRNNPGGYLDAAVDIGSNFIPQGKVIVRENQGDTAPELVYRSHGTDFQMPRGLKTIILVDGGSASASEILSGAMHEHGVAQLVGTQTFGKGSVQELIPLADGASVKITVAKWFAPNGVSISEKGITPDVVVTTPPTEKLPDPAMQKALQMLDVQK